MGRSMLQPAEIQPQNRRRSLVDTDVLVVEELIARPELPPRGDIGARKLVITFAGVFEFEVGQSRSWVDASRLLVVNAGESYVDHHVVPGTGHASVILTPGEAATDEIWPGDGALAGRVRGCSLRIQMLTQLLRRTQDPLAAEELGVAILEGSVADGRRLDAADQRCVRRAKAALHDCPEGRLSLSEIAAELGVTAVHLTQSFKRSEGMPLYRYQTLLRLGRALEHLPEREDITDLAFELGFSSHSHFTAAFKSQLGVTPSHYRSAARARSLRPV
jgi:AraC-like DNA-binding protein